MVSRKGKMMSALEKDDPSLGRIGAFSDGVFAFAITLLVLTIRIPHPTDVDAAQGLLALLAEQWRTYIVYALSFMNIGINWTNHRMMFSTFKRADHTLVWLNLLYLMVGVAFMPVPTAVLGAWLGDPHNQVVATVFYGASATLGGFVYNLVWWYGAYVAKLTSPALTATKRQAHTLAWAPAPLFAVSLTAVAFAYPGLAVAGYVIVVFAYVLPIPRLLALVRRRSPRRRKE
jgi:uncharacterized membrane protein